MVSVCFWDLRRGQPSRVNSGRGLAGRSQPGTGR